MATLEPTTYSWKALCSDLSSRLRQTPPQPSRSQAWPASLQRNNQKKMEAASVRISQSATATFCSFLQADFMSTGVNSGECWLGLSRDWTVYWSAPTSAQLLLHLHCHNINTVCLLSSPLYYMIRRVSNYALQSLLFSTESYEEYIIVQGLQIVSTD